MNRRRHRHLSPTNAYQPALPCEMLHGLCRSLADDDATVRLDGHPLFTFSDGERELHSPATQYGSTWPTEAPARLLALTYDRARYHLLFFGDRLLVALDPDWTQPRTIHFTVPGQWRSPEGPPRWLTTVFADRKLAAAELAFPGARWNLCFEFLCPQPVTLAGTRLRFTVDPIAGDCQTVRSCAPGALDTWR